jgi:chlorophyllase
MVCAGGCTESVVCPESAEARAERPDQDPRPVYVEQADPYQAGPLAVGTRIVEACELGAPVPIRLHSPLHPGNYAVVLFLHGFMTPPSAYDDILRHVASHGFVVLAPELVGDWPGFVMGVPSLDEQAELAGRVMDWAPGNLEPLTGVSARTGLLAVGGHSLGAKVAWLFLTRSQHEARAVAVVDPVDATPVPFGNGAAITAHQAPFNLPSLVLGAGISGLCSFDGANHEAYFEASASPAWHMVARDYGHQDMLDEEDGEAARKLCGSGPDRDGMRRFAGGAMSALFRAELQGDGKAYEYLGDPELMPIDVELQER